MRPLVSSFADSPSTLAGAHSSGPKIVVLAGIVVALIVVSVGVPAAVGTVVVLAFIPIRTVVEIVPPNSHSTRVVTDCVVVVAFVIELGITTGDCVNSG